MAVTGSITTRFIDEKGVDLGKTLIEKDYLISVYPNLLNQFDTPMLMTWGRNGSGQLGDNTFTQKDSPVQTIAYGANWKQVSGGYGYIAAIKTDGTLWCWGSNSYGQLGDNTVTSRSSPVQTVTFGTNWKSVASGRFHTAAIKTDGTLWMWGRNSNGRLGDNTATNRSSPVQTVAFGTNWKQVACGHFHTTSVKNDGTLWLWGNNGYGQLGDNTVTARSSPVQTITFGTNWSSVSANHQTAAVKMDGTLWLWGRNYQGQLGDNTATNKSSPVQTVAFGTNWKQVSCGSSYTSCVKNDGTLWLWGYNNSCQLGDNTATNRSSPVQTIAYGTNWKQVCATPMGLFISFGYHTVATKTDGTLWTWGYNPDGRLGDNTTTNRSSPVQTILYGQNWKSISCGYGFTAAIKDGDF